jgi:hypothetical protein
VAAEGVRQEAQVGLRTTLDVLNQELELRNAQITLASARRNEYVAQASLLAAMGRLEGADLDAAIETYNAAVVDAVRDVADLDVLNRKTRNKMSVIKDGQVVSDVIIQEGVLTNERMNDAVAEPVVYMMDRYVVGGFYRVHAERGVDENLNAPGASFVPLAFADTPHLPQPGMKPGASVPNRFYMYGVIGRLAMLAASYEMEATDPEAEVYD